MNDPGWNETLRLDDRYELRADVSSAELSETESILEAAFPQDLRELYLFTDGIFDPAGQWFILWPLVEVVARNRQSWQWEEACVRSLSASVMTGQAIRFVCHAMVRAECSIGLRPTVLQPG